MANEPERPIEKLLRAAAKKRRDEAGAPFELHPANRRLLQGEVARKFAKPQRTTLVRRALGQLWPRLAWGVAILAVLVWRSGCCCPCRATTSRNCRWPGTCPCPKTCRQRTPASGSSRPGPPPAPPLAPEAKKESQLLAFADKTEIPRRQPIRPTHRTAVPK